MRLLLAFLITSGCGRIGYDELGAPVDAGIDALAVCPTGMTELSVGSRVCIELTEHGTAPWTEAKLTCEGLGRRLCEDAEWFEGCVNAVGLVDMTDSAYEWVAEENAGVALKRGPAACTGMSAHAVVDPYEYRCCAER